MEPYTGIWGRMTRAVMFLLLVALMVLLVQLYVPLFKQNQRLRERNLTLEKEISQQQTAARQMDQEIEALRIDPEAIERRAREQLGYGKDGEIIIRFKSTNRVYGSN
ncbi:MAG: cell division protein FtsB [Limisphaerales bacterium]|jgi:cell division protein FtsB